jgi:hypothetical protein
MYSSANEDEDKYNPASPEYNDKKRDEKKRKEEEKKAQRSKIKHIKIRATQGLSGEEAPTPLDDGNKRDDEREMGLQGGPAGSRGHMLDLATGAKSGTGSAMSPGLPIAMSEPMKGAWSSLLKQEPVDYSDTYQRVRNNMGADGGYMSDEELNGIRNQYEKLHDDENHFSEYFNLLEAIDLEQMRRKNHSFDGIGSNEDTGFTMSEPMKDAWSTLLKRETPRTIAGRRKREARQQFRPSTGQFKTPPGGMSGGAGATMRRFKAHMRGIKGGKKTGLMKPHLAVEMSHRGIQTKQPLSKDPQKYTAYRGQSEARKILGNVRTPFSPHARFGARSNKAGPTGAGRLSGLMPNQRGLMGRPSIRPMRVRRPRMPRMSAPTPPTPPGMPAMQSSVPSVPAPSSSIMMSEDRYRSEILKARNSLHRIELLNLMRRLIQAKEREAKIKKNLTATDSAQLPGHPVGVKPTDDEDPQGPTENLETDAKTFGLDPASALVGRGGRMG